MFTKRSLIGLLVVASILNATLGTKLPSRGYGVQTYHDQVYSYNEGNAYQGIERQNLPTQTSPNLVHQFIKVLRETVFPKRPFERQGFAGFASALQAAAVPLTVAGVVAANRNQILNAINPATTTAATTTTTLDLCAAVTCSSTSAPTCDTNTGLCRCGEDADCASNTAAPVCGVLSGVTQCLCGAAAGCSNTVHPLCAKTSDKATACAHSDGTACECYCTGNAVGCTLTAASGYDAAKGVCNSGTKKCAAS